jgi:hypothetical protein
MTQELIAVEIVQLSFILIDLLYENVEKTQKFTVRKNVKVVFSIILPCQVVTQKNVHYTF